MAASLPSPRPLVCSRIPYVQVSDHVVPTESGSGAMVPRHARADHGHSHCSMVTLKSAQQTL